MENTYVNQERNERKDKSWEEVYKEAGIEYMNEYVRALSCNYI